MTTLQPRIVVVDDDPDSAEALSLVLADWGAQVARGGSAADASARLDPGAPATHWIITQAEMGAPTATWRGARVLVLSDSLKDETSAAAARAGFDILHKPASAESILAWLERN